MIDNVRCPRNLIVSMGCTLKLFMIDLRYPQVNLGRMLVVSQLEILWWIHRCGLAPPPTPLSQKERGVGGSSLSRRERDRTSPGHDPGVRDILRLRHCQNAQVHIDK